jgi:ABC-type glycerol-3-phosphate transport system permease component
VTRRVLEDGTLDLAVIAAVPPLIVFAVLHRHFGFGSIGGSPGGS